MLCFLIQRLCSNCRQIRFDSHISSFRHHWFCKWSDQICVSRRHQPFSMGCCCNNVCWWGGDPSSCPPSNCVVLTARSVDSGTALVHFCHTGFHVTLQVCKRPWNLIWASRLRRFECHLKPLPNMVWIRYAKIAFHVGLLLSRLSNIWIQQK